jgi:isopentenyldiphosphate isomerase
MICDPRKQQAAVIEHLLSEPEAGHGPEGIDDGQKEQPTREDRRYAPDPQKYGKRLIKRSKGREPFLLSVEELEVATLQCMDEKVDILDSRGEKTGEVAWKSEAHRLGLWHRCFHCWIFSSGTSSKGPHLFVQRRTAGKETWPNKLDVTAAGHVGAGEEVLEGGLREIEEELGLRVEPGELVSLGTRRSELEIPVGLDCEFQEVFLLVRTLSPKDLRLQEEEVAAVARLRLDDLETLYGGGKVLAEEWTRGEASIFSVSLADFVPGEDEYLLRVARAARSYLGGGSPGTLF